MIATNYRKAYQLRIAQRHHWPAARREKPVEQEESEDDLPFRQSWMNYSRF